MNITARSLRSTTNTLAMSPLVNCPAARALSTFSSSSVAISPEFAMNFRNGVAPFVGYHRYFDAQRYLARALVETVGGDCRAMNIGDIVGRLEKGFHAARSSSSSLVRVVARSLRPCSLALALPCFVGMTCHSLALSLDCCGLTYPLRRSRNLDQCRHTNFLYLFLMIIVVSNRILNLLACYTRPLPSLCYHCSPCRVACCIHIHFKQFLSMNNTTARATR